MRIDFFARRTHFVDHLLPVWEKIPWINRGKFYVPDSIASYVPKDFCVLETCKNPVNRYPPYSENPMVVCAYGDLECKEKIMSKQTAYRIIMDKERRAREINLAKAVAQQNAIITILVSKQPDGILVVDLKDFKGMSPATFTQEGSIITITALKTKTPP